MKTRSIWRKLLTSRANLLSRGGADKDTGVLASDGRRDRVSLGGCLLGAGSLWFFDVLPLDMSLARSRFVDGNVLVGRSICVDEGHARQPRALSATSSRCQLRLTRKAFNHCGRRNLETIHALGLGQSRCICALIPRSQSQVPEHFLGWTYVGETEVEGIHVVTPLPTTSGEGKLLEEIGLK
jgi:hypothetical protein